MVKQCRLQRALPSAVLPVVASVKESLTITMTGLIMTGGSM